MDTVMSRLNNNDLFDRVVAGLQDEHDIKMLCNMMLAKLANRDPDETIRRIDSIVQCYQAILATKLKDSAVKQDIEKAQEARNDVLRVTLQLQAIIQKAAGQTYSPAWRAYFEFVSKEYKAQLENAATLLKYQD
jgi:cullin-associated NEDD8-dissociated protein 1